MSDSQLSDSVLDALLDGSVPPGAIGTPLAAQLTQLREQAEATTPAANAVLASVLQDGLDLAATAPQGILTFSTKAAEAGILTASTDAGILTRGILTASTDAGILTRGILTIRARGRALSRILVTQFAALGLLSKAAVAGATVGVAAASAGAAGVLPPPAQVAFDDAVGRQVEQVEDGTDAENTPAERDTGVDGGTIADDATGADGSAPGVVGRDVAGEASDGRAGGTAADEASDGRSGGTAADAARDRATEARNHATDAEDEAPDAQDRAPDATEDRGGDGAAPTETPSAPAQKSERAPSPARRGGVDAEG